MCRILGKTSVVGEDSNISHAHVKNGLVLLLLSATFLESLLTVTVLGSRNRSDVLRNRLEGVFWLSFHVDVLQGQEHAQKKNFSARGLKLYTNTAKIFRTNRAAACTNT